MNKIIPAAVALVAIAGGAYYLTRPDAPELQHANGIE